MQNVKQLLIVANWKMKPQSLVEAKKLFNLSKRGFDPVVRDRRFLIKSLEVIICPPFVYLSHFTFQVSGFKLGAQNCFWKNPPTGGGAYTGEISPLMLKNLGVEYVIIGHSERRKYFKETNEIIIKKIKAVLELKLKPILCVDKFSQIPKNIENLIIAYEPLFAIGTGKACSWQKAKEMRDKIEKILDKNVKILYGGSVNSQNAESYIKQAGFNGLLVGGASLDAKEFIKIIKSISIDFQTQ